MPVSGTATRVAWSAALITTIASGTASTAHAQPTAGATTKADCIADFENAQELRAARKLLDARQRLLECGSLRCPGDVQKECLKELVLVEQSLPSIVLALRDEAGHDVVDARALVDGTARALDGQALSLDPGRHTIRFDVAGCEPNEQLVLLGEGEKNRAVVGAMRCGGEGHASEPAPATDPPPGSASPSLALPLLFAGIGVVGLAGFAYFGAQGSSDIDNIRATRCAPACDRDAVTHARTKLAVGDVFGAVGLVSLGLAAYAYFSESRSAPAAAPAAPAIALDVRPAASGAAMLVHGLF